jgi:hypothetical protein
MSEPIRIECNVHFQRQGRGRRKEMRDGQPPTATQRPLGRVPRISRLMALAIRFEGLLRCGEVAGYAELARLCQVTRARMTQIMNLLLLAPDIQEAILFLPRIERGRDSLCLRQLQQIALTPDWRKQRRMWRSLLPGALPRIEPIACAAAPLVPGLVSD